MPTDCNASASTRINCRTRDTKASTNRNNGENETSEESPKDQRSVKAKNPYPYNSYQPVKVHEIQKPAVRYWFYVYTHSNDVGRLFSPFSQLTETFPTDRRIISIMNRFLVQIELKDLEMYKSLPRRIVVVMGQSWHQVVNAIVEMEYQLPEFMRYATHPVLMDTDTTHFACTSYRRTACVTRTRTT